MDMADAQSGQSSPAQPNYGIVLVTTPSQAEAESIASALVEAKLAACVSMIPIRSIYTWEGKICRDEEWQLMIKTNLDRFSELETRIKSMHPYEVPEIIALSIVNGYPPYLQWIAESTL